MQRLAICLDGIEDDALVTAALPWIAAFEQVEAWCAHGDLAARELAYVRHAHGRPPPASPRARRARSRRQAEAIAEGGVALLRGKGRSAVPDPRWARPRARRGRSERPRRFAFLSCGPSRRHWTRVGRSRRALYDRSRARTGDRRAAQLVAGKRLGSNL
jgi:hypothetical protein